MKAPPPPPPADTVLQHALENLIARTRKWQAREKQAKTGTRKTGTCGGRKPRHEEKWGTREGWGGGTKARRAGEHSASPPVARIALARRNLVHDEPPARHLGDHRHLPGWAAGGVGGRRRTCILPIELCTVEQYHLLYTSAIDLATSRSTCS